jgi:hypothetical protein
MSCHDQCPKTGEGATAFLLPSGEKDRMRGDLPVIILPRRLSHDPSKCPLDFFINTRISHGSMSALRRLLHSS